MKNVSEGFDQVASSYSDDDAYKDFTRTRTDEEILEICEEIKIEVGAVMSDGTDGVSFWCLSRASVRLVQSALNKRGIKSHTHDMVKDGEVTKEDCADGADRYRVDVDFCDNRF